MPSGFDLFTHETAALATAQAVLQECPNDAPALQHALTRLTDDYAQLVREMRQLIKLSDRREAELNRLNQRLRELTHELEYQATHDPLTGLLNKGTITQALEQLLIQEGFCLLLFDIDFFKKINDNYGHHIGDHVLNELGKLLSDNLKGKDSVGRFGGEEFVILLRDSDLATGWKVAEDLRRRVENHRFIENATFPITISVGLAVCQRGEAWQQAYARVDAALYAAKRAGRNRVVAATA